MVIQKKANGGVTFVCTLNPAPKTVYLAGDFNQWAPTRQKMVKMKDGSFRARIALPAGTYQYKFVADGAWINDPDADQHVPNPFGTLNSVVTVVEEAAPAMAAGTRFGSRRY